MYPSPRQPPPGEACWKGEPTVVVGGGGALGIDICTSGWVRCSDPYFAGVVDTR